MRMASIIRATAFWFTAVTMSLAFLFVAGETIADPGGWAAVGMIACWALPLIGLVVLAARRPATASRTLLALLAVPFLFAAWSALAGTSWRSLRDDVGPVDALVAMVLGTAFAFLGRHERHTRTAGWAMVALTLVPLLVSVVAGRPSPSALAASLPLLVGGALFLMAGSDERAARTLDPTGPRTPATR